MYKTSKYCKFGTFAIFFPRNFSNVMFVKIPTSRNGEPTLLFTDVGKSGSSQEF